MEESGMKEYILDRSDPQNPSLIKAPDNKLPIYCNVGCAEADLSSLEEGQIVATKDIYPYFDVIHPVGEVYVQYPQQMSPNDLWGDYSNWIELDYSGAFFRADGGSANGFATEEDTLSSCQQEDSFASHNHGGNAYTSCTINCNNTNNKTLTGGFCGGQFGQHVNSLSTRYSWNGVISLSCSGCCGTSGENGNSAGFCVDATHTHGYEVCCNNGVETRPENYTVKIWERIS